MKEELFRFKFVLFILSIVLFKIFFMFIQDCSGLSGQVYAKNDYQTILELQKNYRGQEEKQAIRPVNINKADLKDLMTLPSIGETRAKRILLYRKINGPFKSVTDLMRIKGIGKKILEKLKPYILLKDG